MEIKSYNKQQLKEFIESDAFNRLSVIPISKHRAISQINNPRASTEDILLVVQFDKDNVVGYLGVLPDYLFFSGSKEKFGWLSCFWVHEAYRGQNVAASLFLKVMKSWDRKLLITNIVPWLEPVYQKTKIFVPTIYKEGYRGYMRFNSAELLSSKKSIFKKMFPVLNFGDTILNTIFDTRFVLYNKRQSGNVDVQYLKSLGDEEKTFINGFKKDSWTQRGVEEINWILRNPWILQGVKNNETERYFFSSVNKQFFYQAIRLTRNHKIIGVVILNVREKNLTIPYVFSEEKNMVEISQLIINIMLQLKLNMVTTFNGGLIESLKRIKKPFYYSKSIKKPYLISKKFEEIKELKFQDGDGDCAFY